MPQLFTLNVPPVENGDAYCCLAGSKRVDRCYPSEAGIEQPVGCSQSNGVRSQQRGPDGRSHSAVVSIAQLAVGLA